MTKIWKLSIAGDEDVDVEEAFDKEREVRMLGDKGGRLLGKYVGRDSLYRSRYKGDKGGKQVSKQVSKQSLVGDDGSR